MSAEEWAPLCLSKLSVSFYWLGEQKFVIPTPLLPKSFPILKNSRESTGRFLSFYCSRDSPVFINVASVIVGSSREGKIQCDNSLTQLRQLWCWFREEMAELCQSSAGCFFWFGVDEKGGMEKGKISAEGFFFSFQSPLLPHAGVQ